MSTSPTSRSSRIDPPASLDLDQALHLERLAGGGFRIRYAIADVAAFVTPGSPVDAEAHRRGETAYSPDLRSPLYPPVISEAAHPCCPTDRVPPWSGASTSMPPANSPTRLERAMVASRAKLSYADVQRAIDEGTGEPMLKVLPESAGCSRTPNEPAAARASACPGRRSCPRATDTRCASRRRCRSRAGTRRLSLLTGRAAARLMMRGGVGVLRTMPPPDPGDVARLRRVARALHVDWPDGLPYGELLHRSTPGRSRTEAVFLQEAAVLFRAASYTAFDGEAPLEPLHAAIAAPYAHCTAPLRRLVDRYALETCLAICEDRDPPSWVREALPALPAEMASATDRHNRLERTTIDAVEAAVLEPSVGLEHDAVVVDLWKRHRGEVALRDPAVIGPCDDVHELAAEVRVRLEEADVATRTIRFVRVSDRPTD